MITRTYSITDCAGNSITVQQEINVFDETAPEVCEAENREIECEGIAANEDMAAAWNDEQIAALEACSSDNCNGVITVTSDYDFANYEEACGETGSILVTFTICLLYTSPSPRDKRQSRMPSSA